MLPCAIVTGMSDSEIPITTANVADACLRLGVPVRCAPPTIRPLAPASPISGPAIPVVHFGSVDVFLEALQDAAPGSILVVDNQDRAEEACIGDLVALEVKAAGLAGIVIWGASRDSREIRSIGLPLYSTGSWPAGPTRLDPRTETAFIEAQIGTECVSSEDYVFADDDGVLFVARSHVNQVTRAAADIHLKEAAQADAVRRGRSLRDQFDFAGYVLAQRENPRLTFRDHLRVRAAEIEVDWT
jgi:4-hydroxy-4-methyl-2-oxoglutarate aldolase